jgi:SAM-dependent methyltransferase
MKLPLILRRMAKRAIEATPMVRRHVLASSDYRVLADREEARGITAASGGWLAARTVMRQERAYDRLIAAMKRGEPRLDFRVAAEAVAATEIAKPRVLEVGCGSGYYSDVFATLLAGSVRYTGIDNSNAMIARARARYPSTAFEIADATRLPYADRAFDIVFNGVSLMHIVEYQTAIGEAARVASQYCIFHTVPVFDKYRTTFLRKYAYGAPVVEIVFNKQELISLCRAAGLRLEREWRCVPYDVHEATGHHSTTETYLFATG